MTRTVHRVPRRAPTLLLALLLAACGGDAATTGVRSSPAHAVAANVAVEDAAVENLAGPRGALAAVLAGNAQSLAAQPTLAPVGSPVDPWNEARLYAITNVAMHDALNAVRPRYGRYADTGPVDRAANAAAAVLTAAHDAIVGAAPGAESAADAWYAAAIDALANPTGLAAGVAIGHRAAAAILARRAHDGSAGGGVAPYVPGTGPGDYRFSAPFNTTAYNFFGTGGFADASNWAPTVTPFVLQSASQFRVRPPRSTRLRTAAVRTARYTADFNEIRAIGCAGCRERSAEQSEIAMFWRENSATGWNRIALAIARRRRLDATETARLLAVLQMSEFDGFIAALDSKYHYNFWRPVTAVALAGTDGNPRTAPDSTWQVYGFPTPPVPDYPSAHAVAGGSAAAAIETLVPGPTPFSTTSGSLPDVARRFASAQAAAKENADSRVYIGYHFRHATEVGLAQGNAVGEYVARHVLPRLLRVGSRMPLR